MIRLLVDKRLARAMERPVEGREHLQRVRLDPFCAPALARHGGATGRVLAHPTGIETIGERLALAQLPKPFLTLMATTV